MTQLDILKAEIEGAKQTLIDVQAKLEKANAGLSVSGQQSRIETYDHVLKMIERLEK